MKQRIPIVVMSCFFALSTLSAFTFAGEEKRPPETVTIKLDGSKLPPVTFSHTIHTEKTKLECVTCHHKDTDPKQPEACTKCHPAAGGKGEAPGAKDVFHKQCQTCHKESSAKDVKAPTKCNECHKK
ncbi:MAG: Acidic cytochrome c3 precursor [Syntrophorhabdus sp. PtaU1.Bin002]|nr:MAG: Acidic cytochrome c3 precursor [Syntrophorhabdus sp. PtaB.Bin006]OPY72762.1 MAG: Acidic cytochrome c3 precursor [Syntrophorhabdus sp. PtaU1.Bin002]